MSPYWRKSRPVCAALVCRLPDRFPGRHRLEGTRCRNVALSAAKLAELDYDVAMLGSSRERGTLQQRLALLKQQHLELLALLSRSHSSLAATDELEAKLEAVAAEMSELEFVLMPPLRKTA